MSTSLATILADFVREYGLGIAGTATSATTTTVVDASNLQHGSGGQLPNEAPLRITSGAGVGGSSYKTGLDTSTGTLTFAPAITGNTGTPTYVISNVVNHIDRLFEAINRGLQRRITRWLKIPLTDVPDGDMMGITASDHWAATTAAVAYATLSMANGWMQRCLQVTTSAGNGYAQSDSIPVEGGETRNFQVFMRVVNAANTAKLVLVDVTNASAAITLSFSQGAATTASRGFITARGTYSVPATCNLVAWRLTGVESGAVAQFGMLADNGAAQTLFPTQPHLNGETDISTYYLMRQGGDTGAGPADIAFLPISDDGVGYTDFGWGLGVEWDQNPGFPIFYDEFYFFPALTSDTDTTDAPEEIVLLAAAIELYTMLVAQSGEKPTFYRGKPLPTATLLKLQQAQQRWASGRIQRQLANRRITLRRTYSQSVTA